jgi:hypothetical protein
LAHAPARAKNAKKSSGDAANSALADPFADAPEPAIEEPAVVVENEGEEIYWLKVRSVPSGAEVLVDGQLQGKTPFQRRIFDTTRPYALTVRKTGYDSLERMLSSSDEWVKNGNLHTLLVAAKLAKAKGEATTEAPAPAGESPKAEEKAGDGDSTAPAKEEKTAVEGTPTAKEEKPATPESQQ